MSIAYNFDKFGFLTPTEEALPTAFGSLDKNFRSIQTKALFAVSATREFISASAGAANFLLPAGSQTTTDYLIVKTDSSVNTVTITPKSPDLINGTSSFILRNQYDAVLLSYYNGIWYPWFIPPGVFLSTAHNWTAKQTFAGGAPILGVTDGSSAPAGYIGEVITSTIPDASGIGLVNNTVANITTISLTAGNWLVWGLVGFDAAGTTSITALFGGTSKVSATFESNFASGGLDTIRQQVTYPTGVGTGLIIPFKFIKLTTTTTLYLLAEGAFGTSTLTAFGTISALRVM